MRIDTLPALALAAISASLSLAAQGTPPDPGQPGVVPALKLQTAPAMKLVAPGPKLERTQSDLKKQRAKKLAKEVFDNADWFYDYDEARAAAAAQGKLLLVYFTRSYAP